MGNVSSCLPLDNMKVDMAAKSLPFFPRDVALLLALPAVWMGSSRTKGASDIAGF